MEPVIKNVIRTGQKGNQNQKEKEKKKSSLVVDRLIIVGISKDKR